MKRPYKTPELTRLGSVSARTLQQDKDLGPTDGFLFMGQPIQNAS